MDQGRLIIIDSVDGAGKDTAMQALVEHLRQQKGKRLFDLVAYTKEHRMLPQPDDPRLDDADVLLSCEPTFAGIGQTIREEIVAQHPDRTYSAHTAALAFSLDRHVLFTQIILPFLQTKPNRLVLQVRGLISSLAYQPLQDPSVTLDWILSLEGNQKELTRAPDLLILLRLTPQVAMERLSYRGEKRDGHIFETKNFQTQLVARYDREDVRAPFLQAGTHIMDVDASRSKEEVAQTLISLIEPWI